MIRYPREHSIRSTPVAQRKKTKRKARKQKVASQKRASSLSRNQKSPTTEPPVNDDFQVETKILKVDQDLGLVFGWALVCEENGEPYFDTQGDHITEKAMLEAAADFCEHSRANKSMHEGEVRGPVVFTWPLTKEVAKAFNIQTDRTGLMIAVKPDTESLEKFKQGEYRMFSIGGCRIPSKTEEVE